MSRTRQLVDRLREELGRSDPMPIAPPLPKIQEPPSRVFPRRHEGSRFARETAQHTTAMLGIGHVGTRYATDVVLQFQAELAVAHAAVDAVLPDDWAMSNGWIGLSSRVQNHREFLLRPDLGRRLADESLARWKQSGKHGVDVQPILADGLSAVACMQSGRALLESFTRACQARGLSVGVPVVARFARVWLEDEIGAAVGAKVAAILLGERPGLGTGDGLSAYLVYDPKIGNTDGQRNMMSNIHARGTRPEVAGDRLAVLARAMVDQRRSGVELDLSQLTQQLGDAASRAPRAPQVRERLVERQP
ncbi:MAG: ethanolamine ammonia-lyase light chain EutC [Planctomycetota bacterium]|nr:ethanolamine ammonia-lyase light chain EutC [Planctomycetota bacterium]